MAEAPAPPAVVEPAAPVASAPAEPAVPVGNIVADAALAPVEPPAPDLKLATVAPEAAREYLTAQGLKAEDIAALDDAALKTKYDEAKAAEAAKPIEYKDFKVPEGFKFDDAALAGIKSDFAEAKLSQDQAQKLIDKHVQAVKSAAESPYKLWNETQAKWQKEVMADPEIGGAKFDTVTKPAIAKAITSFAGDAAGQAQFKEAMNFTGAGNNPTIVRFLARLGASLMEGSPASGAPPKAPGRSFEEMAARQYPNQGSTK